MNLRQFGRLPGRRPAILFGALLLFGALGAQPAAAQAPIVVCTIDDLSGDFSIMSTPKTYGYQLAVEEINAAGGVMLADGPHPIQLITYDGQSDIARYQQLSQRCIFEDEAAVVMAGYTGAEREAARAEVVRNEVIYWHNNQGEGGIADRYSFFSGPTPEQQVLPSIQYMIETFGPNMIFIGADYNFCRAIGQWVRRQGKSGLGIEAQRAAVARFAEAEELERVAEFTEVETGKGSDDLDRRPQLAAALAKAKQLKCPVVVAKLDRLSRDVAFIAT